MIQIFIIREFPDVQPAAKVDGWETEPFVLTERGEALFL